MSGIDRVARKEKELAEQIRSDVTALRELQDKPEQDPSKINALAAQVEWSTRIFDDRRKSIRYVCEVPTDYRAARVCAGAGDPQHPRLNGIKRRRGYRQRDSTIFHSSSACAVVTSRGPLGVAQIRLSRSRQF